MYSRVHVLFAALKCVDAIKTTHLCTDLDSYEWLGRLDARMDWYLAPLAGYWEW